MILMFFVVAVYIWMMYYLFIGRKPDTYEEDIASYEKAVKEMQSTDENVVDKVEETK